MAKLKYNKFNLSKAQLSVELTFSVEVDGEVLEDVHVWGVSDGGHAGGLALTVDVCDGLRTTVQHQRVDQRDVVTLARLLRHLQHKG